MKKSILLFLFVCLFGLSAVLCQTVNDIKIEEISVEYMQIIGTAKLFSTKVTVELDFGKEPSFWATTGMQVKDELGKPVVFKSMIDALNFFGRYGYDLVSSDAITASNQIIYHYLLKKHKG